MMRTLFARRQVFICLACLLPINTWAETPDPLDSVAATPALEYQSPLNAYQPFREPELSNWREATKSETNNEVNLPNNASFLFVLFQNEKKQS